MPNEEKKLSWLFSFEFWELMTSRSRENDVYFNKIILACPYRSE